MPKLMEKPKEKKSTGLVDSVEALNSLLERVKKAQYGNGCFGRQDYQKSLCFRIYL